MGLDRVAAGKPLHGNHASRITPVNVRILLERMRIRATARRNSVFLFSVSATERSAAGQGDGHAALDGGTAVAVCGLGGRSEASQSNITDT